MGPRLGGAEYETITGNDLCTVLLQWDRALGARNTSYRNEIRRELRGLQWDRALGARNTLVGGSDA